MPKPATVPVAPDIPGDVVTASYACEGNRVDLLQNQGTARITMSDGRLARLGSMARSTPRTWRDLGLAFTLYPTGAVLEEVGGRTLDCTALQATPASG